MAVVQLAPTTHRRERRLQQRRAALPPALPALVDNASHSNASGNRARNAQVALPDPRLAADPVRVPGTSQAIPPLAAQEAVLLELFGRQPVAFHRAFVDVTGSVTAALWLSHAIGLAQQADASAPFQLSQDDCNAATGLSRREQETARARLRAAGLMSETRQGRQIGYRLDFQALATQLLLVCGRSYIQAVERAQLPCGATGTSGS
jgi:hypothetical protein